jgi:hypothetical protein
VEPDIVPVAAMDSLFGVASAPVVREHGSAGHDHSGVVAAGEHGVQLATPGNGQVGYAGRRREGWWG